MNLQRMDANLLVTLDVLLETRSTTATAKRLGRSQPAVSHALARLRDVFADPLLVRGSGQMVATQRALELAAPLRAALAQLDALVAPVRFEPGDSSRVFRVAAADAATLYVAPGFVSRVSTAAPSATVEVLPLSEHSLKQLEAGDLDLIVGSSIAGGRALRREPLFGDGYAVLMAAQLSLRGGRLDRAQYLELPHISVGLLETLEPSLDAQLAAVGVQRRVVARVSDFSGAVMTAAAAAGLLTAPARLAKLYADSGPGLAMSPLPFEVEDFSIDMIWHTRSDHDPAQLWLREQLRGSARHSLLGL